MSDNLYNRVNIYLSGRNTNNWKNKLINTQSGNESLSSMIVENSTKANVIGKCIDDRFGFIGPWDFLFSDIDLGKEETHRINSINLEGIRECDVLFAWIDTTECHKTLCEIGYARALLKSVYVLFSSSDVKEMVGSLGVDFFALRALPVSFPNDKPDEFLIPWLRMLGYYTDSPIEYALFEELMVLWYEKKGDFTKVQCQHPIGKYRADLAYPDVKLAIECDGHDYHKTKQQRTHDAKRDRFFKSQGWEVLRFTGSEIHKDVAACAQEVKEAYERLKEVVVA